MTMAHQNESLSNMNRGENPTPEPPTLTIPETIILGEDSVETETPRPLVPRPEVVDTTYLGEKDLNNLEAIIHRGRASETEHYREVMDSITKMGGQAVMSLALAGDLSDHHLIVVNYVNSVDALSSSRFTQEQKSEFTEQALEALSHIPPQTEVEENLKYSLKSAETRARQKDIEAQRSNKELEYIKKYLKTELEELNNQRLFALSEYDIRVLDKKIEKLEELIGPKSDSEIGLEMVPTTGELEESLQHLTHEDMSPPRGIKVLAEKTLSLFGLHAKEQ